MEKQAKIYILGAAAVLVSGVKLEDWKKVEKFFPEALKIVDEDHDTVFNVRTSRGGGSVSEYGVIWGSYTSSEGYATVTVLLDEDVDNKQEAVTGVMGSALLDLMEIEKDMPDLLAEIKEKEAQIGDQVVEV